MNRPTESGGQPHGEPAAALDAMYPLIFSTPRRSAAAAAYLHDPSLQKLVEFFETKGLQAIKDEDQRQHWYEDWIAFQSAHGLYASLLSPQKYSALGNQFDLLRLTRFLEVFAYFSPAHGYSLQVSFLGLFSILMGSNDALKQQSVAALEKGDLFAFGVSEQNHGSDLLGNEFNVTATESAQYIANGSKYYIGNANCAAVISILAQKTNDRLGNRSRRATPILFALRPAQSVIKNVRKIPTLGVRSAFVGQFQVQDHEFSPADVIAEGRAAWDAVIGTVTLGKFFLGFGSVGICERAFEETITHLTHRILYGKPVIDLPHIASAVSQAYARLTAMKLYAYRALDYIHAAGPTDRRYLLYCAVQKARVSTEGVKAISLLSECIGAKAFESDTYFEMALRDIQLIPSLEGSVHINLDLTARFIPEYFDHPDPNLPIPQFTADHRTLAENPYLMEAASGQINTIKFRPYRDAYRSLKSLPNIRIFARQAKTFRLFVQSPSFRAQEADARATIGLGHAMAILAYAQLIAENAAQCAMPPQIVSTIFHLLINDLSSSALALASFGNFGAASEPLIQRIVAIPATTNADWDFVLQRARMSITKERT